MAKYIDADELLKRLNSCKYPAEKTTMRQVTYNSAISDVCRIVDALPAAYVQEVKHGRWIETTVPELWECSVCGCVIYSETEIDRKIYHKWCGRCGAKMDEAVTVTGAYCDRNLCKTNELNNIGCDECEIAKHHNLEDDDTPCQNCGEDTE